MSDEPQATEPIESHVRAIVASARQTVGDDLAKLRSAASSLGPQALTLVHSAETSLVGLFQQLEAKAAVPTLNAIDRAALQFDAAFMASIPQLREILLAQFKAAEAAVAADVAPLAAEAIKAALA